MEQSWDKFMSLDNCIKPTQILFRLVFSEESEGKEVEGESAANWSKEATVESKYNVNTVLFILGDADEWTLQTRNYYNVNSLKFIFRMNSSKIYTVAL